MTLTFAKEALLEPSDEEVLAVSEEDDFDDALESDDGDDDIFESADEEKQHQDPIPAKGTKKLGKPLEASESENDAEPVEDEDDGGWGPSKKDYYNADPIETQEDAIEEEKEALRLQRKQLEGMTEADFGLDEDLLADIEKENEAAEEAAMGTVITQRIPRPEITNDMGPGERMRHLRAQHPEFEPLANEFIELREKHDELLAKSRGLEPRLRFDAIPNSNLKYRTLAAYLSALAMYFALLTSPARGSDTQATAMAPDQIQRHNIMDTLLQCRDLWQRIRDIPEPDIPAQLANGHANGLVGPRSSSPKVTSNLVAAQSEGLLRHQKQKRPRKSKGQKALEAQAAAVEGERQARLQKTEESLASLSTLISKPSHKSTSNPATRSHHQEGYGSDSDLGEPSALTNLEAAEKAAARKKKSLKFYTSQIAQRSARRTMAGREAGGDDDIPYRDRKKDRLLETSASTKKQKDQPSADLDGASSGDDFPASMSKSSKNDANAASIPQPARARNKDDNDEEDYYDFIAAQSARKKASKKAAGAGASADPNSTRIANTDTEGMVDADGKRALPYQILKNKGLHAPRKKEVRNPRVKKRKRYEDKKKKLRGSGQRPVWKGGEGRGGYGGELTGITKGVSKGVRL